MEKRAFLAVILMFLVLVVFQMLARTGSPPKRGEPETTVQAPAEGPAESPVPAEVSAPETAGGAPAEALPDRIPEVPEREVVVETDLFRAVFSNRGPRILSWKLKKFPGLDSEWVELVPQRETGGAMIGPRDPEGSAVAATAFEVSTDHLALGERSPSGSVTFTGTSANGSAISETLRFNDSSYVMEMDLAVEGASVERGDEIRLGWSSLLPATEPDRREEKRYFAALASVNSEILKNGISHLKKEPSLLRRGAVHWAGLKNKYFAMVLVPEEGSASAVEVGGDREAERLAFSVAFPAREEGRWKVVADFYGGPIDYRILKNLGRGLDRMVDFGNKLIRPLSKLVYWMLVTTYRWIPNYGVVIIILSVLTKVLFYPLTQKSMKSMQSMQELQPKMAALKEKYKNDPKRMNQEVMKLYKEHGVNPLGGCLPLLLQSPVFFALYAVLQRTIELRRAPFVFWINDLSRPDVIFSLPPPLPHVSLLPILMGVSMFLQQRLSSASGDPRQKMMGYMMPVFLTLIFFRMPSGLVLYWLVNTVLSVGQQYFLKRRSAPAGTLEPAA